GPILSEARMHFPIDQQHWPRLRRPARSGAFDGEVVRGVDVDAAVSVLPEHTVWLHVEVAGTVRETERLAFFAGSDEEADRGACAVVHSRVHGEAHAARVAAELSLQGAEAAKVTAIGAARGEAQFIPFGVEG